MQVPTFQCPYCGNNFGMAVKAYLYGGPFTACGIVTFTNYAWRLSIRYRKWEGGHIELDATNPIQ